MKPEYLTPSLPLTANGQLETRIVAFATSAGGLHALTQILAALPAEFEAACIVLQHLSPNHVSHLASLLQSRSALTVKEAQDGDPLRAGSVYVGLPDLHMIVQSDGLLRLTHTARQHFSRPSADVLFESLAAVYKQRVIAVVLTGKGVDGAEGIQRIKAGGGVVIAQNEATAESFGMPGAAIQTGDVDYILPLNEIAPKLVELTAKGRYTR
jgi:two-component system, chemotaxis family, protein-glutamate methylesterase/glutaminase